MNINFTKEVKVRYFKYKNTNKTEKNALRIQYDNLTEVEKRMVRKDKVLDIIAGIVFFTVSIVCLIGCFLAISKITVPESLFLTIICEIGIAVLRLTSIIVSLIIGALLSSPIWNKVRFNSKAIKQQILSEACAHLRDYYELQEPCIVTKCYDSSDKRFINHDVCIFVVGDELRITANLKHGFFHGKNDLGCYVFNLDEVFLSKHQGEKFLMAELKGDSTVFLLGYRAKSFIEKNFISKRIHT